jgi:ABC-2 type transport system permease protein
LTIADRLGSHYSITTLGWREFRTETPFRVLATTLLPRQVLQCLFFVLVASPSLRAFAFVGGVCAAQTVAGIQVADLVVRDKISGTAPRLRIARQEPPVVMLLRVLPYVALGLCSAVAAAAIVGPALGMAELIRHPVAEIAIGLLISTGMTFAGLAVAVPSAYFRAEALAGNTLSYLIIVAAGVFIPAGKIVYLDAVGSVLPMTHGLAAIRDVVAGKPFAANLVGEAVVCAAWLVVAVCAIVASNHLSYRSGVEAT